LTTASIPAHRIAPLHRSATVRFSATRVRTGDAPTSNTAETKHRVKRFLRFRVFFLFFERVYFFNNKDVQKKQKTRKRKNVLHGVFFGVFAVGASPVRTRCDNISTNDV